MRREAWEEAGVRVGPVQLSHSQPWPIGRAGACELMIGCFAQAISQDGSLPEPKALDGELAEVAWFSRAQALAMIARAQAGIKDGGATREEAVVPGE